MNELHGFRLLKSESIAEIQGAASLFRHERTGAELVSVEAADENKVFGITLRTPPGDSTGVAHILEHSVLCGSRKYPAKEPFVELLKGSVQTFLNAFTFPDKTCYPVASQNLQDFYNLIDVYMDAVLHPLLTRHTHAQEAWHYEIERPGDPLIFKGVVFNEMKGVYSSPDSALSQYGQESLFPDITYGLDYGGHPHHIPDLTYEQLKEFHRRYYHPSNARIWFYGDDPPDERLRSMDQWLKPYDRLAIDSSIPLQPPFKEPRNIARTYHGEQGSKAMLVVSWLLCETTDVQQALGLELLAHMLIGTPSSPLRKALIESALGEDLAGVGLEGQLRQMYFSTGLKGVAPPDVGRIEPLIFQTLEDLAGRGIAPATVEASLNSIEFRLRENNTGNYPRGLALMTRSLATWLYGGDPFEPLAFERPLDAVKAQASKGYFEDLIRRWLLRNPHRATLLLEPDPGVGPAEEAREKERLAKVKGGMSERQIADAIAEMAELKRAQGNADAPEILAKIPRLGLQDLPRNNQRIPMEERRVASTRTLFHDLPTRGILYLDIGFDLSALPSRLLPYAPLFGRALLEMGTEKEDFVSLDQRIGARTGGIDPDTFTATVRGAGTPAVRLLIRGKAMARQATAFADILRDVLTIPKLDHRERFRQIVLEEKADLESDLIPTGHSFVNTRLRAGLTLADWADEQMDGIGYLFFVRRLAEDIDRDWPRVLADLESVRRLLIRRSGMICNVTSDADFTPALTSVLDAIPDQTAEAPAWTPEDAPPAEGLGTPAQVNYVGWGADLYREGYRLHGSALVISRYLRNAYLWERVRVQGGAYGGMCWFDPRSGVFTFVSYRDPNLEKTLATYRDAGRYLQGLELSEDELTKAIVGAIGDLDQYQLPDAKGFTSMTRLLAGEDDAFRQRLRDEVLSTTRRHFREFGDALQAMGRAARTVVLGPARNFEDASAWRLTKVLT
jgi:hypothetical protein